MSRISNSSPNESTSNSILSSKNSNIVNGINNNISSSLSLGGPNEICSSKYSTIISHSSYNGFKSHCNTDGIVLGGYSYNSYMCLSNSSIISSYNSSMKCGNFSPILGGECNFVYRSRNASILSGRNNVICISNLSTVVSGDYNCIINSSDSSIISGATNRMYTSSKYSVIIGGVDNKMFCSKRSAIIGGLDNSLYNSYNSVIIGGNGLTMSKNDTALFCCIGTNYGGTNYFGVTSSTIIIGGGPTLYFKNGILVCVN
jgi:hypothetical protein